MPHPDELPEDLLSLIEKRELEDRREAQRRSGAASDQGKDEQRVTPDRRVASRRDTNPDDGS